MGTGNALNLNSSGLVNFNGSTTFTAVTTAQYNTLVGAPGNGITNISPGTSGQVLTSNGASANPSYQNRVAPGLSSGFSATLNGDDAWNFGSGTYQFGTSGNAVTKLFDVGSNLTTGAVFTAPNTGYYLFGGIFYMFATIGTVITNRIQITIQSTSVGLSYNVYGQPQANTVNQTSSFSQLFQMSAGNTVGFYMSANVGTITMTVKAGSNIYGYQVG